MPELMKKRLLKLAGLLEANADDKRGMRFDLRAVGRPSDSINNGWTPALDCGTTGCAVGLACVSGAFARAGLGFRLDWSNSVVIPVLRDTRGDGRVEGWGVEEEFFGLTCLESSFLFMDSSYPRGKRKGRKGELAVAKRIRKFVEDRTIALDAKQYG